MARVAVVGVGVGFAETGIGAVSGLPVVRSGWVRKTV